MNNISRIPTQASLYNIDTASCTKIGMRKMQRFISANNTVNILNMRIKEYTFAVN